MPSPCVARELSCRARRCFATPSTGMTSKLVAVRTMPTRLTSGFRTGDEIAYASTETSGTEEELQGDKALRAPLRGFWNAERR